MNLQNMKKTCENIHKFLGIRTLHRTESQKTYYKIKKYNCTTVTIQIMLTQANFDTIIYKINVNKLCN